MSDIPIIIKSAETRMGFRFVPEVVRALIPHGIIGAYLLVDDGVPLYIGRSDHCLRTRLSHHPLFGYASHFVWEPCRTPFQAFCLESLWFHRLSETTSGLNLLHPARPVGTERTCPFCPQRDVEALWRALYYGIE